MITLTPAEEHLRDFLADRAAKADPGDPEASTITYKGLAAELDPDGSIGWKQGHPRYTRLITALYHVSTYEVQHGRPMPTAFVVHVGDGIPGIGLAALARKLGRPVGDGEDAEYKFWKAEMNAMVKHWSAAAEADIATAGASLTDAQFGC